MPRLAQPGRQINQAGRDHQAARVDRAVGAEVGRHRADGNDPAAGNGHIPELVAARGWIDHPAAVDQDFHASFPAMIDITAMRTAMPNVTCGKITLRAPSATADEISTPRLIGPGCITIASGLASASLSAVRP